MELRDREFFVYRIGVGYLKYKGDDLTLYVHDPTAEEAYEAQQYALQCYEDSLFSGMYTREVLEGVLKDRKLWTDRDEEKLKGLPKEIEDLKLKMWENLLRSNTREALRKHLRRAEKQLAETFDKKYSYDIFTCEGYSSYAKSSWLLEHCTRLEDGSKYNWENLSLIALMNYCHSFALDEKQLRELAKTEPFRTRWSASGETIFKRAGLDLTEPQTGLILWSKLYDGVQENPDCPSDDVLQDDDLFDGWLISERRKRESEKNKNDAEAYDMDHDEIFIPAQTQEDMTRIDNLNDPTSKMVKQQRHNQIEKEGSVKHGDLGDIRRDKQMSANEQYRNRVKG
tara:strand:+ start:7117 stop:8136 length:1020 start_codon:yes stop_codon:yes gene_type:complete